MVLRSVSPVLVFVIGLPLVLENKPSLGQLPGRPSGNKLVLIDGSDVPLKSLTIDGGMLSGEGVPANLTLDDLRRIELPLPSSSSRVKAAAVVELRGGGHVLAQSVSITNEKCRIEWTGGEPLSLPIDLVRAVRLDPDAASAVFDKAISTPSAELDRVFIKDEAGKLSNVTGLIDSLDGEQLKIEISGQQHSVPRSKLFGIVLAQSAASDGPQRCVVEFHDGSRLGGETLALQDEKATLAFPAGASAAFSWTAVSRVTIRSSRVTFLSDLKPLAEEQQPIVTLPLPAQRDQSLSGKPLMLGTRTYDKGLGVHARSSLTFAAEKKWDVFAATIGLDADSGGKGDCVFVVLADGQPLLTRRLKGNESPEDIHLPIAGREQVTLLVEPGEGLDLADHANWCDARFIKNRE
jgi:hypothetical protein